MQSETHSADDIGNLPGFLIRRCNQVAMAIFLDETSGFDLSPAQYGALSVVAADPGLDQTRLMERSALDRSSVTKCVERLEARGLIRREVDPADRRVRRLYITGPGQQLRTEVRERVLRSQARLLAPLGAERATQLLAMLKELADSHNAASRVPLRDGDAA